MTFATALGTAFFLLSARHAVAFVATMRRRAWVLPVVLVVGPLVGALYAGPFVRPLLDRLATGAYTSSGGQRLDSARAAVAMIRENPLLGVGYMGYERSLER